MDGRPPKRQRRAVQKEDQSEISLSTNTGAQSPSKPKPVTLSSRPKATRSRAAATSASAARAPSASPTKSKPKSLHSFFSAASEGQRWSAQKFEAKQPAARAATPTPTIDVDDIEDDYGSYDEIFSQVDVPSASNIKPAPRKPSRTLSKRTATTRPKSQPSKRFLMPPASNGSTNKQSTTPASAQIYEDTRPWAQQFGPVGLDELAVHKRKVSDVQKWLDDVFEGRRKEVSHSHVMTIETYNEVKTLANPSRNYWSSEVQQVAAKQQPYPFSPKYWATISLNGEIHLSQNIHPATTSRPALNSKNSLEEVIDLADLIYKTRRRHQRQPQQTLRKQILTQQLPLETAVFSSLRNFQRY